MDVRVQRYRGAPVLTWWEGTVFGGYGGTFVVTDGAYTPVARVKAGNGYKADLHEFLITSRNTALISIYNEVRADLSGVGGASTPAWSRASSRRSTSHPVGSCSSGTASTTSPLTSRSSSPSLRTATSTTCTSTRSGSTTTATC